MGSPTTRGPATWPSIVCASASCSFARRSLVRRTRRILGHGGGRRSGRTRRAPVGGLPSAYRTRITPLTKALVTSRPIDRTDCTRPPADHREASATGPERDARMKLLNGGMKSTLTRANPDGDWAGARCYLSGGVRDGTRTSADPEQETQHRHDHGRRRRHLERQRLPPRNDGRQHAQHRPPRQGRRTVH